jgi:uncharacterized protein YdhG (YjbR/CyaY superfamily)
MAANQPPLNIDEYIAAFPLETQKLLEQVRQAIREIAPDAQETISYAMPAFKLNGNLVYFAAYKHHIGFYATPTGHEAFKDELSKYKTGKGSVQFPLNQAMPLDLIKRIVAFRVESDKEKMKSKLKSKKL